MSQKKEKNGYVNKQPHHLFIRPTLAEHGTVWRTWVVCRHRSWPEGDAHQSPLTADGHTQERPRKGTRSGRGEARLQGHGRLSGPEALRLESWTAGLTAWASRRWTGQGGPAKGRTGPVAEAREGVWEGTWRRCGRRQPGGCGPGGLRSGGPARRGAGGREREGTRSKAGKCQRKIGPE